MAYIWEDYDPKKKYFVAKKVCPYIEVFHCSPTVSEVNPLLRFSELFELLHNEELREYVDDWADLENVVFHYLAQLDKCKGMNYVQSIIEHCREEIYSGYYGERVKSLWDTLYEEDRKIILYELSQRLLTDRDTFFADAMGKVFPLFSICFEKNTSTYYLYIGAEKKPYNENKYNLLRILFWNKKLRINPIWEYHYGIVGADDTMQIDFIQIV